MEDKNGDRRRLILVILVIVFGLFVALCEYGNTETVKIPLTEWDALAGDLASIDINSKYNIVGKRVRIVLHQYLSRDVDRFSEVKVLGLDAGFLIVEKNTDTYYVPIGSIHYIKLIGGK